MNLRKLISDNLPLILTSVAVTGVVSTTVLAVKATPAAIRDIQEAQSELLEISKLDIVKLTWHHYIPAALIGGATIASIVGVQSINMKRQAALVGLWSLTDRAFLEYKAKVIETLGEKKEQKIVDEIVEERMQNADNFNKEIIVTGQGTHRFKDTISGRYFEGDLESVRSAVNDINFQCINEMYASVNDFYRLLGLPPTAYGEESGWRADHKLEVTFVPVISEDNEPCIGLTYRLEPIRGYWKGH